MADTKSVELAPFHKETLLQIQKIRKHGNFQTMRKRIGLNKVTSLLTELYPKYNVLQIEEITGVPKSTLQFWFDRLNIPFKRSHARTVSIAGFDNRDWVEEKENDVYRVSVLEITPELAYAIGFALGDGSVDKFSVDFFNKDREIRAPLLSYLKFFGSVTERERPDGLWKLRLSSKKISNLIKNEEGLRKDTVDFILSDEKLAQKFIAAFWDAEGSVLRIKSGFNVVLNNADKWLLNRIKETFESNSIESTIIEVRGRKEPYYYKGRPIIARKKLFRLRILTKSLSAWAHFISTHLLHSKKSKMAKNILKEAKE